MFTQKSLIVSVALILALICTGIVAASAHTTVPVRKHSMTPYPKGIPAIRPPAGNHGLLSILDVKHYLNTKGAVVGSTASSKPPTIEDLRLTDILNLDKVVHFLIPGQPVHEEVYYAQLKGPFLVIPNLPLPILSTLLPSLGNLPALLPHLGNLSGLNLLNTSTVLNSLPALSSLPHSKMPDLSNLQQGFRPALPTSASVVSSIYEVFNARTGNLLAWG